MIKQWVVGVLIAMIGVVAVALGIWNWNFMAVFFGFLWLIVACLVLQVEQFWQKSGDSNIEWTSLWCGLLCSLVGAFIIWASMGGDPDDSKFNAPRWVGALAGGVFLFAGIMVIRIAALHSNVPPQKDLLTRFIIAMMITCFAAVATWVAFGPGDRAGNASLGIPAGGFSFQLGNLATRLAFSPGALILLFLAVALWIDILKRKSRTRKTLNM